MVWWVFAILIGSARGEELALPAGANDSIRRERLRPPDKKPEEMNEVRLALMCIQSNLDNDTYFNPHKNAASCMIKRLAPALESSFVRHGMTNNEVALYLSQALVESSFFNTLTEKRGLNAGKDCEDGGSTDLTHVIDALTADATGLDTKSYAGDNIGNGIIQITGFDNQVSAIDYYLQQTDVERAEPPKWKTYWEFQDGTKTVLDKKGHQKEVPNVVQLQPDADRLTRRKFMKAYREAKGRSLDVYKVISEPEGSSSPNLQLRDDKLGTVNSSLFMTEMSMAYWHGKCKGEMATIANSKAGKAKSYQPDSFTDRRDYLLRSAAKCVKGNYRESDIKTRGRWYDVAKCCVHTRMILNDLRFRDDPSYSAQITDEERAKCPSD